MNKLRLTNKIENHFYLDFNWKDETHEWSVSWQRKREKRISGQCRSTNSPFGLSVSTRFRR